MKKEIINQQKDKSGEQVAMACPHKPYCPSESCDNCKGEHLDALKHLIDNSVSIDRVPRILNIHKGEVLTEDLINKIKSEIRG